MLRIAALGLLLLACSGCYKAEAEAWKDKFVKEVEYHYRTTQIKNAEIAAVRLENDNQRVFIEILRKKIDELGIELAKERAKKSSD